MSTRIVCMPGYNFGDTFLEGSGLSTAHVAQMAGHLGVGTVMDEHNLPREEVLLACWFYAFHQSRQSKLGKLWRPWTAVYYPKMGGDWAEVPDPPRLEAK